MALLPTERDTAVLARRLGELIRRETAGLSTADRAALTPTAAQIHATIAQANTPWFRALAAYDPAPVLRRVRQPVLAIGGSNDLQVPAAENLAAIAAALRAGGNADATVREMPGLNHLFQTSRTGAPAEYARIDETFAPAALALVADWITGRFMRK